MNGWLWLSLALVAFAGLTWAIARTGDWRSLGRWFDGVTDAIMIWWTFEWLASLDFGSQFDLDLDWN